MFTKLLKSAVILIALLAITSCLSSRKDVLTNICQSDPELCNDLHKIGNCRYKRTNLIRARYYDKIAPSAEHTSDLLDKLDTYQSCLELTLMMQLTRHKERKQERIDNFLTTQKLMSTTLEKIKGTQDPHLAYYLWSHYQDSNAKRIFLNAANKKEVKDIKLLTKLATVYAKQNPQYSLDLFYHALRESHSITDIPANTFTSIMIILYQKKKFEQAYIWALIAQDKNTEEAFPINLDLILQKGVAHGEKLISNEKELKNTAEKYQKQLTEGLFSSQAPKLDR